MRGDDRPNTLMALYGNAWEARLRDGTSLGWFATRGAAERALMLAGHGAVVQQVAIAPDEAVEE